MTAIEDVIGAGATMGSGACALAAGAAVLVEVTTERASEEVDDGFAPPGSSLYASAEPPPTTATIPSATSAVFPDEARAREVFGGMLPAGRAPTTLMLEMLYAIGSCD